MRGQSIRTTDSSARVCAASGINFVWAGAQSAPLREAELYIFYSLVTSAFPLLTAVHLLLGHFFSSLFIDIEHACFVTQLQLLCSNCYKISCAISIHL